MGGLGYNLLLDGAVDYDHWQFDLELDRICCPNVVFRTNWAMAVIAETRFPGVVFFTSFPIRKPGAVRLRRRLQNLRRCGD